MMLIYSDSYSERLKFVLAHVFDQVLGVDWKHTSDAQNFMRHKGPRINYSSKRALGGLQVLPHGLMSESNIRPVRTERKDWNDIPIIFPKEDGADLPFDIFSAIFFMISRYEEYLPFSPDVHGRFEAKESMAWRHGFLNQPVVDLWIRELWGELAKMYNLKPWKSVTKVLPTLDIDNAWAIKNKGTLRSIAAFVRSMLRGKLKMCRERLLVLSGRMDDPFDTFEKQNSIHSKYSFNTNYFFLLGDYRPFDKNISHRNEQLRKLVLWLADRHEVGLHPSYATEGDLEQLEKEVHRLQDIIGKPVKMSRQHYIKIKFPATYRALIEVGIEEDRSMGFASASGFRAGTCRPFYFYDLEKEYITNLLVKPFCMMDTTLRHYEDHTPESALKLGTQLFAEVKEVGGEFSFIFHNESLGNSGEWKGWGDAYEELLKIAVGQPVESH